MTEPTAGAAPESLQFDRVVAAANPAIDTSASGPAVVCSRCNATIKTYYYQLNGSPVCAACKQAAEGSSKSERSAGAFIRAALLGLGAAIVGAVIYYGVIAITNFEIGIVAILIGYLVGAAVRMGARGAGGRRFQILAVGLTYFSVGLAYSPLALKGLNEAKSSKIAAKVAPRTDSAAVDSAGEADKARLAEAQNAATDVSDPTVAPVGAPNTNRLGVVTVLLGLGATFLLIFALPVISVVGSLPSGLISALIIGIGMRQAWRMTAGQTRTITGPHRIATTPQPAAPDPV